MVEGNKILDSLLEKSDSKYQSVKHLGGGEFSNVHLVRHKESGQERALKLMDYHYLLQKLKKQNLSDIKHKYDEIKKRFIIEAQLYEKIQHPNIVKIHETGVFKEEKEGIEIPYFVMDYIKGSPLAILLEDEAPFTMDRILKISRDVLGALEVIHRNKIIHRDLKPSNIMIEKKTGSAIIIDFGIAKDILSDTRLTTTGALLGSPMYMAPEQFIDSSRVGIETDIYSFGVALFEMMTGQAPFEGANFLELMAAHRQKPTPDAREINPGLPPAAAYMLKKAMAKEPDSRYRSAASFLADIEALSSGKIELPIDKPAKARSLKKILLYVIGAVVILAAAGLFILGPPDTEETRPVAPPPTVSQQEAESPFDRLMKSANQCIGDGQYEQAKKHLDEASKMEHADPAAIASLLEKIAEKQFQVMTGEFERLKTMLDSQASSKEKIAACKTFLDKYSGSAGSAGADPVLSEVERQLQRLEIDNAYAAHITAVNNHLENNRFDEAVQALARAKALKDSEEIPTLSQTIETQRQQYEKENGAGEYNELIKSTLDLAGYREFKAAYPRSIFLPDLTDRLKQGEPNLPPEKYWDRRLEKNSRGYYELTFSGGTNGHRMIYVPGKRIWIDKYEVSNRQYGNYLKANQRAVPPGSGNKYIHAGDEYPAVVTYEEAIAYCRAYGLRLPTPDEWEYAAGQEKFTYPWGDQPPDAGDAWRANYDTLEGDKERDGFSGTAPVKSFESFASPLGAVNMAGNVWEWAQGRILKGGGIFSSKEDLVIKKNIGGRENDREGFRCVKDEDRRGE